MEILVSILVPTMECVSPQVATRWRDHRDLKKNSIALKKASEKLKHRKLDLKTRLETEVIHEETKELQEVKFWLESVESIICEAEQIVNEVAQVKFLSRARLSRTIGEMIGRVEGLHEEGVAIREGSLVRKIERRGREKPTTAMIGGESSSDKTRREILGSLVDKKATRIGVHGMGGLGKTTLLEHVHNELLKPRDEIGRNFNKVIWVTASKGTGVKGLQEKIGREFELGWDVLRNEDDEEVRAKVLLREFKNKCFVLIIDDLWEDYPLEKVGVPDPTAENGCKLVLTTRSRDVCSKMGCDKIIEMGFLSEQEASELFFDKVGKNVASDPKLGKIARRVAIECAGLPLAVVTSIRSLPHSVVKLGNISILLLRNCNYLHSVPDISELRNLTRLDLNRPKLKNFPQGLEKLVKLVHLDLSGIWAQAYPEGLLSNLIELRYLSIALPENAGVESAEELTTLNKLETLKVVFMKFELFHSYFKSARPVRDFRFTLGYGPKLEEVPNSVSLSCRMLKNVLPISIPNDVEQLSATHCDTSLCRLISVQDMKNLQRLELTRSKMEYMFYHSPAIIPLLSNITELKLHYMRNLRAFIGHEGDGTEFSALKKLSLLRCPLLKRVFVLEKEASLPNLEEVVIEKCLKLEEIIAYKNKDAMIMELPALKSITLTDLPKLKSVEFVANSLSHGVIRKCPDLKKVSSSLQPFVGTDSNSDSDV